MLAELTTPLFAIGRGERFFRGLVEGNPWSWAVMLLLGVGLVLALADWIRKMAEGPETSRELGGLIPLRVPARAASPASCRYCGFAPRPGAASCRECRQWQG